MDSVNHHMDYKLQKFWNNAVKQSCKEVCELKRLIYGYRKLLDIAPKCDCTDY